MREIPTDDQVDILLRRAARASLSYDARTIETDEDLEAVRARVGSRGPRRAVAVRGRRWLAVAAAVLVVGGVVAIAIMGASSNDDSIAIGQPATTGTALATNAPSTTLSVPTSPNSVVVAPTQSVAPTTIAAPTTTASGRATADPTTIETGGTVTITPFGTIDRACDLLVRTTRLDGPFSGEVGSLLTGSWSAGTPPTSTQLDCRDVNPVMEGPQDVVIPRNMPAGTYEMCVSVDVDPAGCAVVTVTRPANEALAEPATVFVGDTLTITPSEVVARACNDIVTAIPLANAASTSGQLVEGRWVPAPGPVTQVTYPACLGEVSAAAVQLPIPVDMPPGVYAMCLDVHASYDIQESSDPACAVVTVLPTPLPACWTQPVAPPTLSDGTEPGDPVIDEIGWAVWGDPDLSAAVRQMLGTEPNSWWLDDAPDGVQQVSAGPVRAAVASVGDHAGAPKIILMRGTDGCDRQYEVGPLTLVDAFDLAQSWVESLAASPT